MRKTIQKSNSYRNNKKVKKDGDKAVLNYEKFSKLKIKSNKLLFTKKGLLAVSQKKQI